MHTASVIIPTFNRAKSISRAIESVLAQINVKTQLIVIDDGSTDNTKQIVEQYPQVEYYRQSNQRQAAARNHGLKYARHEFIASLDSDDLWDANFLETSIKCLIKHNSGFVFSNYREYFRSDFLKENIFSSIPYLSVYLENADCVLLSNQEARKLFIDHSPAPSSSMVVRREFIPNGWDTNTKINDDRFLALDAILKNKSEASMQIHPSWTKTQGDDNICDGHSNSYDLSIKEVHDFILLLNRYSAFLNKSEIVSIRRQMATSQSDAAYLAANSGKILLAGNHQLMVAHLMKSPKALPRMAYLMGIALKNKLLGRV